MLDDRNGRVGERADDLQRAVQVQKVVVREVFPIELPGSHHTGGRRVRLAVDGGLLMGILAISQNGLAGEAEVLRSGKGPLGRLAGEEGGNGSVVYGRVGKCLAGQLASGLQRRATVGRDLIENLRVLRRVGRDRAEGMVLGGCPNHRRTTDIDLLDDLLGLNTLSGSGCLEGVKVHHDQLEGHDIVIGQRLQVLGIVVAAEDSSVDCRMQGLESPVHHLGKARVVGHVANGDPLALELLSSPAGAVDFDTRGCQSSGEPGQPHFIAHADQRPLDWRRIHHNPFSSFEVDHRRTETEPIV